MQTKFFLQFLFALGCAGISLNAFCEKNDKQEKVYIEADKGIYNYRSGIKVFEGNVKVTQGTSNLLADKLVTKDNNKHQIQEAIAYGFLQPARYWTLPRLGEAEIHANAKIIKFYPQESNVTMEQEVEITQGENSFKGQVILYNKINQTITVPASKNGRAILVYDPDK